MIIYTFNKLISVMRKGETEHTVQCFPVKEVC
jgi:hypothetical protein